jgi:pimeloyl-ACP methyl ester carboxylesterase
MTTTRVLRPWDWSLPPTGVHREVLADIPPGWADLPRAERKPPVLFVHGVAHAAWVFQENWMAPTVERGYPAYALSLRGHGGSAGHRKIGRTLMRDYVHDIMQTITELPQPPVLIGHSMGALLAQLVAERYPVRALVLLTPAPAHGGWAALGKMFRQWPLDTLGVIGGRTLPMRNDTLFAGLDESTGNRLAERMGRESPIAQYELLRRRAIGPITVPVLVIGAQRDALVPARDVARTAARFGVQPVWMRDMGHDVMLDAGWDRALNVVLDWLDEVCPNYT